MSEIYDHPRAQTFGEKAVGLPCADPRLVEIKVAYAAIIDRLHALRNHTVDAEVKRMASIAATEAQTSHFWACEALRTGRR